MIWGTRIFRHKSFYLVSAVGAVLIVLVTLASGLVSSGWDEIYGRTRIVGSAEPETVSVHLLFSRSGGDENASPALDHYVEHLTWLNAFAASRHTARHSNAWTSDIALGYWLSGAPEDLPAMLRTLSRVFDPITLSREFANQERDIVRREYDLRLANRPDAQAAEDMDAFLYQGNAIAASVIGTPGQINALRFDDAKAQHRAIHQPEWSSLLVTGDVSPRQVRRIMKQVGFPHQPGGPTDIAPPPFVLSQPDLRVVTLSAADAAPRMIWRKVVTLPKPVSFDLLDAQTRLLRDILESTLPGGIVGPLRFDTLVAKSFQIAVFPIDERHVELNFRAEPGKDIGFDELRACFEAALTASAQGIPAETYARVHERFRSFWPEWSNKEATRDWMASYVLDRASNLRVPMTETELAALHSLLSAQDIDALVAALAGPGRTAIAFIGKDKIK
ncbi:hypothetical protein [uncultured Tateyamaria sp.]|uniref:hypothetical protein n=1 Tax=uncultured Tateyamaria sp. TaxID=455651 RepID=UPI002617E1FC|nr:hypothetical protein [uncultured Tateyamaria sp.]